MRHESARHQVYVARIGYFLCGYAVACWAPLIPIVQSSLQLSTEAISVLVLSFGIGSVSGMLLTNLVLTRISFKLTYAISCATTALAISLVALTPGYFVIMGAVILFGVSIGALEVSSGLMLDMPIPIAKKLAVMTMRLSVATTPNRPSAIKIAPKKAKLNGPIKRKMRGASKRQVSMHTLTMQ